MIKANIMKCRIFKNIVYTTSADYLKFILNPFIILFRKTTAYWLPVYLLEGQYIDNNKNLNLAYVGNNSRNRSYYNNLFYGSEARVSYIGRIYYKRIVKSLKENHPDCCFIIWEYLGFIRRYLKNKPFFIIPLWIKMKIDINEPLSLLKKKSRSGFKNIDRLIRKYDYTCEITNRLDDFKDFFHNMYIPFAQVRFGERVSVLPFEEVIDDNSVKELFLVKSNSNVMAGTIVKFDNGHVTMSFLGVKQRWISSLKNGILGALYFFVIESLQNRGYKQLLIGDTKPFLTDGTTQFKIRLLASVDDEHKYIVKRSNIFTFLKKDESIQDFLVNNPYVFFEENRLNGAIWVGGTCNKTTSAEKTRYALELLKKLNIRQCTIYSFNDYALPLDLSSEKDKIKLSYRYASDFFIDDDKT